LARALLALGGRSVHNGGKFLANGGTSWRAPRRPLARRAAPAGGLGAANCQVWPTGPGPDQAKSGLGQTAPSQP